MNKEYLLGAGGIALPFLISGLLKKESTGAEIVSMGFKRIPQYDSADISVTWKNTSQATQHLYCAVSLRDPLGTVTDFSVKAKDLASGASETSVWEGWIFSIIGDYYCRASIWDVYPEEGVGEEHRLADTAWTKVAECYEGVPTAVIVKAMIDSTQWYP